MSIITCPKCNTLLTRSERSIGNCSSCGCDFPLEVTKSRTIHPERIRDRQAGVAPDVRIPPDAYYPERAHPRDRPDRGGGTNSFFRTVPGVFALIGLIALLSCVRIGCRRMLQPPPSKPKPQERRPFIDHQQLRFQREIEENQRKLRELRRKDPLKEFQEKHRREMWKRIFNKGKGD